MGDGVGKWGSCSVMCCLAQRHAVFAKSVRRVSLPPYFLTAKLRQRRRLRGTVLF